MDILEILIYLAGIFLVASSVYGIYKTVRARVVAGKAGIVKVCVNWVPLIIQLTVCALFAGFGINRMNEAQKYLRAADKYEAIIDRLDNIIGDTFQQVAEKAPSESLSESSEEIRQKIAKYRELGEANKTYATILVIIAVSELVSGAAAVWYITEEGIMLTSLKIPEPIYTVLNGNKIELHFVAQFKNANKVITFKSTPENLALFGRFMKWEQPPQTVPVPQDANFPNDKEQL